MIQFDLTKATVATNDEILCAVYPVIYSNKKLIKRTISKIGYKTTFVASKGNDIEVKEIKKIFLSCHYCSMGNETGVWIDINDDKDLIFLGYYSGNIITETDLLMKIFKRWLISGGKKYD